MSDIRSEEYKRILTTIFDRYTNIVRSFIHNKILQDYNYEFESFLKQNQHDFFTRTFPKNTCCCGCSSFIRISLKNDIYKQLYDTDYNISCKNTNVRTKKCCCRIVVKDVSLDSLDIVALACIAEQSGEVNGPPLAYINKIKEVRNILCHPPQTDTFSSQKIDDHWETIETAIGDLLDQMSIDRYLKMILTKDINDIRKIQTTFPIQSLMSIEKKVDSSINIGKQILQATSKEINQDVDANYQQPSVTHAPQTEKIHLLSDSSESEDKFTTTRPLKREFDFVGEKKKSPLRWKRFKQAKGDQNTIEKTNEDNVKRSHSVDPDMSVEMQSHTFSFYFVDIPEHLERFVEMSEAESGKNVCVQWSFDCPPHWNISDLVDDMNKKMVNLKGWFRPVLIFQDRETGRLILQCNTQCQLFSSYQQFELEVRNFIELIEDKCQLQTYSQTHGDKHEDVGISLSVIMPPDGCLLKYDPKNFISETEKEPVHAKRTDLDYALVRLGVKQCLEMKYKEYNSKVSSSRRDILGDEFKPRFYRYLRDTALQRKRLLLKTKLIKCVKSHLPVAVAEFPDLDLFDDDRYSFSCNFCSENNVECWCEDCKRLYCNQCIATRHTDFLHDLKFNRKAYVKCPALTLIKTFDIIPGKYYIYKIYSLKLLNDKLIMLTEYNQQYALLLWKDTVLDSNILDGKCDKSANSIVVIDSHTFAYQTEVFITIFTINNDSIIHKLTRIPTDAAGRSFAHVNGILYIGTDSGIVKMTLEGNKVGEIKCKNVKGLYANGTQIYLTTDVKGEYVNVIDTTKGDTMWSLQDFPSCPDHMECTSNGHIVFLKEKKLWFTSDKGKCCYILYCGGDSIPHTNIRRFCLQNDEIYLALDNYGIDKYRFNEMMLTQLRSQPSTSAGTSFQKYLSDPGTSALVSPNVSVPVTSVSIEQTQGGVVNPDIETLPVGESYLPFEQSQTFPPGEEPYHQRLPELDQPNIQHRKLQVYDPRRGGPVNPTFEVPGSSNSLQNFPMDTYSSQMGNIPVFGHQSLPQERETQREGVDVFQPFLPPISYSDVAFRQLYSNPGPSQPPYIAPPVHTYGRPPHSPPDDDNITSNEDLSDESRD